MAWIKANRDEVDFLVVYQFNRIFRNTIDAAITKRELSKYSVRIVSAVMDLGDGPESAMVEMILHAVDEYRSTADGADIAFKMGAKARNGGTLGRARLGYLNARDLSEGRNIGIVTLDPERAPLVRIAFELYATGDYSLESLQVELTDRGFRTRPGRFPAGPISISKLAALLRDPYYIGYVTYKGELITGRHEALIDTELFDRVQDVLDQRAGRGQRQRRHTHYLKGMLWCGRCHDQEAFESRMILNWANGRGGQYLYFFCRRRQQHLCAVPYTDGDAIEGAIIDLYSTVRFPPDLAEILRTRIRETMDEEETARRLLRKQLTTELARLDRHEEHLLDLAADGELATTKVKRRLATIQRQRDTIGQRLDAGEKRLEIGARLLENALKLLDDPQAFYRQLSPEQRRLMNETLFTKLYVHQDEISDVVFRPPFDELLGARDVTRDAPRRASRAPALAAAGVRAVEGLEWPLANIFVGGGSNKALMVGAEGLEPPTCWL